MEIYLIRHGHVDYTRVTDPYTVSLTERGRAQASRIAALCQDWDIQFLCTSIMLRAQQTADAISEKMPHIPRWDLEEIEEMNVDDLLGEPTAGPLVSFWTEGQVKLGYERVWVRTMAALARIQLYAAKHDLERIAIVAHGTIIRFLLLNWLGLDWHIAAHIDLAADYGATCKVSLAGDGHVRIDWINRL